jgi:hypothetical protein
MLKKHARINLRILKDKDVVPSNEPQLSITHSPRLTLQDMKDLVSHLLEAIEGRARHDGVTNAETIRARWAENDRRAQLAELDQQIAEGKARIAASKTPEVK